MSITELLHSYYESLNKVMERIAEHEHERTEAIRNVRYMEAHVLLNRILVLTDNVVYLKARIREIERYGTVV